MLRAGRAVASRWPSIAYLQYTSGSTRAPAGVVITHRNLVANFEQIMSDFYDRVVPRDATIVSWLPFYHDMGLVLGVCAPILGGIAVGAHQPDGFSAEAGPVVELMASKPHVVSAAPNFAFELAVKRTTDEDMAGLDLGGAVHVLSGSERVHAATFKRFTDRFARFNFRDIGPAALVRTCRSDGVRAHRANPAIHQYSSHFDPEKLSAGHAKRCESGDGTPLISYGVPRSPVPAHCRSGDRPPSVRPERPVRSGCTVTMSRKVIGGNRRKASARSTARLVAPSEGTPEGPWLRTGDLGFVSEGELFIMGRIKDLLIVYGRNHSPDDIEATIQEITGGRCAAIAVPDKQTEKLVAIVELKKRGDSPEEVLNKLRSVKGEVTSAISKSHGLRVADLVAVSPGSIPITTSGKVRRAACVEQYRRNQFSRLDA